MSHSAPDHCIRAASQGCGCKRCIAWRKAKAEWRATRSTQPTPPMEAHA